MTEPKMATFWLAYEATKQTLLLMSEMWEDADCADIIERSYDEGGYPKYLPSFDEFVHDFIGIWPRR